MEISYVYLYVVIKILRENLEKKSKTYENPSLGIIFLLNNYDYILRLFIYIYIYDVIDVIDYAKGSRIWLFICVCICLIFWLPFFVSITYLSSLDKTTV